MKCVGSAVWLAVFLLTAGAAGEGDGLARILRDSSQQFLRLYREILCEKPCSLIETCQQGRFVYLGEPQDSLGADPSLLARACASTQLEPLWTEITQTIDSLYFIDAGGNVAAGYHRQPISETFCENVIQVWDDPRKLRAYVQTVSSPKSIAIVNLDTSETEETISPTEVAAAIQFLLHQTLIEDDRIALFTPGINITESLGSTFLEATSQNIDLIGQLLDGVSILNPPSDVPYDLLSRALSAIQDETSCYQAVVIFLHSELLNDAMLSQLILEAASPHDNVTVFLYTLDGLTGEAFVNSAELYCNTKAVLLELDGTIGYSRNSSLLDYLNYFAHGTWSEEEEVTWINNNSALFTDDVVSTACVALYDYTTAKISNSGVLLGVLCMDVHEGMQIPQTCPVERLDLFDFSFLRYAYQSRENTILYPVCNISLQQEEHVYWDLLEEFISATAMIGHFSFEIVQSDYVNTTCPTIQGRVLTGCSMNDGDSSSVITDPDFLQPVTFTSSSLLWASYLEEILPVTSADFNSLNASQPLWQSVCSSSYLDNPWKGVSSTVSPTTFFYGDYIHGYMREYPGHKDGSATCLNGERLDARLQPWFSSTASGPKTLVIITDNKLGFQDDIQEMKGAVLALLNTLNHRDRFNIIPTTLPPLFSSVMPGTQTILESSRQYVNQSDYSSQSRDPNTAIQLAIQNLNDSLSNNSLLILLTDNSFVDPSAFAFTSMLDIYVPFFLENNIRVFTYLFSLFQEGTLLKNVSCTTGGLYDRLHNLSSVENALRVTSYYHFYAAVVQPNEHVWSEVFVDELTGMNSTRGCSPFYRSPGDDFNTLIGVSCISIPVVNLTVLQMLELNGRIDKQLQALTPNLTFQQENQLRGIHKCDRIAATSAESFRFRVENTVRRFRSTAEESYGYITSTPGISTCPHGNQFYDSCSVTPRPSTSFSSYYGCDVSLDATAVYSLGFLAGTIPLLNFSINAFGAGSEVFNILCTSEALNNLWLSNQQSLEPGVLWHYYGDYMSGVLRFYPYADCSLGDPQSESCQWRSYDPRQRPWYVSATTGPKSVYIIIHASSNSYYSMMQSAALNVLNTLTHRDFVYVRFTITGTQYSDSFIRSDINTRGELSTFIEMHRYSSEFDDPHTVITDAFQLFQSAYGTENSSNCHQVIILFTDSSLDQDLVSTIDNLKQNLDQFSIDIYTYTFGGIEVDPSISQQIACDNGGEWFAISSSSDVELNIYSYYKFYSASVQNSGVVWSEYFQDVFTGRDVISACLPVYDPATIEDAPLLLGVTCVDVDPLVFINFPDGEEVLRSVIDSGATFCPSRAITAEKREFLRLTKCFVPSVTSAQELTNFYELAVGDSAELHSEAYTQVVRNLDNSQGTILCPFDYPLYDACNIGMDLEDQFSYREQFSGDVSFDGLGVLFHEEPVNVTSLRSDQPFFATLCPAVIEERVWQQTANQYNLTNLQFFATEDGLMVTYPARQLDEDFCQTSIKDPRLQNYYTSTASGYKDVIIILDLASSPTSFITSIYTQAAVDVLLTLSGLDYFDIIAGGSTFKSTMVETNADTIEQAVEYLSVLTYQPSDQAVQIKSAFQVFGNSRLMGESALCQSALIIITNREITVETLRNITVLNPQFAEEYDTKPVKIFVNTFGYPSQHQRELELVCDNSGIWNVIEPSEFNNPELVRDMVTGYYRVLAKAANLNLRDPLWSEVYEDAFGVGMVTSVCLPVYDTFLNVGKLLGVSCISVPLSVFEQFPNGSQFLNELLLSQREGDRQCAIVTLDVDEIDPLRPEGFKCIPPTNSPTVLAPTASVIPSPVATGELPKGNTGDIHPEAIAGIVVGVIAFCVLVAVIGILCVALLFKWRKGKGAGQFELEEKLLEVEEVDDL